MNRYGGQNQSRNQAMGHDSNTAFSVQIQYSSSNGVQYNYSGSQNGTYHGGFSHNGVQVNIGGNMFQSMSTMPSMPPMRPMAPMPAMSPMLPMPTIQLPPQYDRTQNHIVQYPKPVPHSNGPNQNRNRNDSYNQPRSATGQNPPAQNTPQSGQANDPPPSSSTMGAGTGSGTGQSMECAICLDDMNSQNISTTPCGHLYCTPCIKQAIRNTRCCPLCKKPVAMNKLLRIYLPASN